MASDRAIGRLLPEGADESGKKDKLTMAEGSVGDVIVLISLLMSIR